MLPADRFHRARITYRRDIAPDLWIIRLDPGGAFGFTPGQYATLGLAAADSRIERPYSIASSPYEAEVEVFHELVPDGGLTPLLHKLQPGGELTSARRPKACSRSI
jgi:ferredoxin/flavodoxin---NADP+ reductase